VVAVDHGGLQHPGGEGRGGHRGHPVGDHLLDHRGHVLVAEHVDGGLHGVAGVVTDLAGVGGVGQVLAQAGGHAHRADLLGDHRAAEEVALHEGAQAPADVVLAFGDDRRVGDGDAQRVAEQGGDREPVGQGPHHGRFGEGLHVAGHRGVELPGHHEHHRRQHQQPGGQQLHAVQRPETVGLVGAGCRCRAKGGGQVGRRRTKRWRS
jgi:hypothetical protein